MTGDKYILAFDPGWSSGVSLGRVSEGEPYELITGWQFSNGVLGVKQWVEEVLPGLRYDDWVCEKFVPLSGGNFSLTVRAVEPVAIEGYLYGIGVIDREDPVRMRRPQSMYLVGGKSLAEKKKRSRQFLKDTGNYLLPKQLGAPDSDDFLSATLHAISYAAQVLKSKETHEMMVDWVDNYEGASKSA